MRIEVETPDGAHVLDCGPDDGRTLAQVLRHRGTPLNTRCGERALCRACQVEVLRDGEWRVEQGCRLDVEDGLRVRIPAAALLAYEPQALSDFRLDVSFARDPMFGDSGFGVAIDIGTTTVAVLVADLGTGEVVARAAGFNQQMRFGDDVLTRINQCVVDPAMTATLQRALVEDTLLPLLDEALAGRTTAGAVVAGNTTMLHLFVGENPSSLGTVPFRPVFLESREFAGSQVGLESIPRVVTLPGASAYVGADIVAGMVATGFTYADDARLFIDVGTNGEMVARRGTEMVGCATAAGPAFEGSGLSCGVRAGRGAIAHLDLRRDGGEIEVGMETIGGDEAGRPIGLCGSAYVDFLAQARSIGALSSAGRLTDEPARTQRGDYGREFLIALGQGKRPLTISDPDVARLLQAKAAIAAGAQTLMRRTGLAAESVDRLVLAGGFGMHLRLDDAIACGLLPGFRPEQIELVGNTSLGGAYLALMDRGALRDMNEAAAALTVIELNEDPDFEDAYIDALALE